MRTPALWLIAALAFQPGSGRAAEPDRTLINVEAFARLYGYLKYFHPTDTAAELDWDGFAYHGVHAVLDAPDDAALAAALDALVGPFAPDVRVATELEALPVPRARPRPPGGAFVAWQHRGPGVDSYGCDLYCSNRVRCRTVRGELVCESHEPYDMAPLFEGVPARGEVLQTELVPGIWVHLPLTVPARRGKTVARPRGDLEAFTAAVHGAHVASSYEEDAFRYATVVVLWNVLRHFFPYWDEVEEDPDAVLLAALARAQADGDREAHNDTLRGILAVLQDGHVSFRDPGFGYGGVTLPARLGWVEGQLVVLATSCDELQVGDVVETIGGEPATEVVERAAARHSGTRQWRIAKAVWLLHAGWRDVVWTAGIERDGERVEVSLPYSSERLHPDRDRAPIEKLEDGVFYVDLTGVSTLSLQARMEELARAPGVVFDLRGYPNGTDMVLQHLLDEPETVEWMRVAQVIRPEGERLAGWEAFSWDLAPAEPRIAGRVAFLTDGRAISYAESILAYVEAHEMGAIVGGATAGANGNVVYIEVMGTYDVRFTGMKVTRHDGARFHGLGVRPTVPVERTLEGVRAGRDEVLEAGLAVVRGER